MPMNYKKLEDLSEDEWEKVCMKCGKCCMCKYSDNGIIHFSNYMCQYFDLKKGECSCYDTRFETAKGSCKKVSLELIKSELYLLPPSCAYRRLYEGRGLPHYHPLITGDPKSVEKAGETVKSLSVFPETIKNDKLLELLKKASQDHWDSLKIMEEASRLKEKFEIKFLESYPMKETAV